MKRTYRKNVLRTVRGSLSRFLAITAIVALGVGFFAGLLATTPDMRYSADRFFDDTALFDVRVVGTLALTDDDVEAIRAVEGVEEVMPAYSADALVSDEGGEAQVARFHSVPLDEIEEREPEGYLNRIEVIEGRLPVKDDECVVLQTSELIGPPAEVGETLTLAEANGDMSETFARTSFKVVGVVKSSYYFSIESESASIGNGTVAMVLFTGEQNFTLPAWTDVYLTVAGAKGLNSLTDEYTDYVDETIERIEAIAGERCAIRYADVRAEAEAELADAKRQYEDARAEADEALADAKKQLEDGRAEIEENEQTLEDAKAQLEAGQAELDASKESLPGQLTSQTQQLADAKAQVTQARAQYEAGVQELETQQAALNEAKSQLSQAQTLVETLQPLLDSANEALAQIEPQLAPLRETAASAQAAADAANAALAEAEAGVAAAEADLAAGQTAVANAQNRVNAAQAAIDAARGELSEEEWAAADPNAAALLAERAAANTELAAAEAALPALEQAVELAGLGVPALQEAAEAAQAEADAANSRLSSAEAMLAEAQSTVANLNAQMDTARAEIEQNTPLIAEGEKQLEAGKQKLASALAQITAAEAQIAAGETSLSLAPDLAKLQLDLAEQKLENSREQLADGEEQLADAKEQLAEGEAEYERQKADAEQQLADAEQQIRDGEEQLAEMEEPEWYVLGRGANVSYASFLSNVDKVEAIARVFPIFFFLVAALVALTTMTRMVEEERLQIGTMKALGYARGAIAGKYVLYAMTATAAGCAVGLSVGFVLFPTVIWNAYTMMYELPRLYCQFNVLYAAIAAGLAIVCTLAATLNACWSTLAETPASLMRPKAPPAGKRILLERVPFIWRRMKFTYKVTARNLFRYKKRFFMTVIGISGCTALLVTGFGLHDSISDIVNVQFGDIFTYDATVTLQSPEDAEAGELHDVLENASLVADYMPVRQEQSDNIAEDGTTFTTYLFVPMDEAMFTRFVTLAERTSGDAVAFSQTGVVITEKMSERMGVDVGDEVTLQNADGDEGTFRVDGVAENYVENYVYLSAETYEAGFGTQPEANLVVLHAADASDEGRDALGSALLSADGASGVSFIADLKGSFSDMMSRIDIIVVVLILSAGALAFIVLYNLTNINITERVKEIATIKVLGFFDREVSAYVYRESIALSVIGTLVGLVLGVFLHMFVIHSVEVDAVMFGRTIKPLSYVASAVLTMVFSILVNLVMHRKLRRISMVESMKAPE